MEAEFGLSQEIITSCTNLNKRMSKFGFSICSKSSIYEYIPSTDLASHFCGRGHSTLYELRKFAFSSGKENTVSLGAIHPADTAQVFSDEG